MASRLRLLEPDLDFSIAAHPPGFLRISELSADSSRIDAWLAAVATLAEGIDRRTAAGYFVSVLCWSLGRALGALYLSGVALPPLTAESLALRMDVEGSGKERDLRFALRLEARDDGGGVAFDRANMRRSLVALHAPLVWALNAGTGLSPRALWRLVTDGISAGFLQFGKRSGSVDFARQEVSAILADPQSPLHNPHWQFVEIAAEGRPAEWLRLRGGCCRFYRTAGGEMCTTCVLRSRADSIERLRDLLRRRI